MQIAALAYDQLDPAARVRVDSLIALNPSYATWVSGVAEEDRAKAAFIYAAVWADDIKQDAAYTRDSVDAPTKNQNLGYADYFVHDHWHYINVPFSSDGTKVVPPVLPNALTQIQFLTGTLESNASDSLKSYSLVWLIHLVGDIHQPLHTAARFSQPLFDDRGGIDETVQTIQGKSVKLHIYWDSLLGDTTALGAAVIASRDLPVVDADTVAVSDPALWVIESFAIAQNDVYTDLIGQGAGPFSLTQVYEENALIIAKQQAALAGARLANLINSVVQ